MRRSVAWNQQVASLAHAYFKSGDTMGMLYAGGRVTPKHLALVFTPQNSDTVAAFGSPLPTREQFAAMARDVNATEFAKLAAGTVGHDTGMAAEFHILSCLHRLGYSANMTLGNKKAVDIVVSMPDKRMVTIDVKGLAGSTGWPVDNVGDASRNHFLVFVCYRDFIDDPWENPEVYVVPSVRFDDVLYKAPGGRRLVRVSTLRGQWQFYEHAWHLLAAP